MGQELVIGFVEIEKGKQPKWPAAERYLKKLSNADLWDIVLEVEQVDGRDETSITDPRARVERALRECKSAWETGSRLVIRVLASKTVLLLAGDATWGDSVDEVTDINYFADSGMAHAAGFLCSPRKKKRNGKRGGKL